jgi:uracil-DNA glycosylase
MTDDDRIKLEPSWKAALRAEFDQPYMHQLREFLQGSGLPARRSTRRGR